MADGLGGERAGELASETTVDRFVDLFASGTYRTWPENTGPDAFEKVISRAVREISDEIRQLGRGDPSLRGLGSTLVLGLFHGDRLTLAHVGDSRCYLLRAGNFDCLTADHTWVANQVEAGMIAPEEAQGHPQRGLLTQSLGDAEPPQVAVTSQRIVDGDVFLFCSDGLNQALTDAVIHRISARYLHPQDIADILVAKANEADGSDNITAVVARCRDVAGQPAWVPEDTEPITRPEILERPVPAPWWKSLLWAGAGAVAGLLIATLILRVHALQVYERSVEHFEQGQYLHAEREMRHLLTLLLDEEKAERVIEMYRYMAELEAGE